VIRVLHLDAVDEIAQLLTHGAVVAVPTDTVYGLAASVSRPDAVGRLFELKDRPSDVALPILIGAMSQLAVLGVELNEVAATLSRAFWPGAMTIVVNAPRDLATLVGSSTPTVGLRLPGDESLRDLLRATGPLAVTSANTHGATPCHDVDEVLGAFDDRDLLAAVIDGGRRDGAVSTVVDASNSPWRVLRSGVITEAEIKERLD
jgi:tRNA threonylcarbamoyl adenosine modification protein (Sua5/YciO/YrdC/YwlC family)